MCHSNIYFFFLLYFPESIVRANLVEQIPYVFMRCYELTCPLLESYLYDRLLDIVLFYLKDVEQQIRKNAYSSLMLMIEKYLIDNDRITNKICPAVLDLTNVVVIDSQHIDYHTSAVGVRKPFFFLFVNFFKF